MKTKTKSIKILHIIKDEKFFDSVSDFFDNLTGVVNIYIFHSPKNYKFKHVKYVNKLKIVHSLKEYHSYFSKEDINIIYFHSLGFDKYYLYKYIDNTKIVIWWAWGYDIYYSVAGVLPPLINIELYKAKTRKIIEKNKRTNIYVIIYNSLRSVKHKLMHVYYSFLQKKMISRIDYFTPVLSSEYEYLSHQVPFFRAKPFMLNSGPGKASFIFKYEGKVGNILLGNSFTYTNNHFDILQKLKFINIDRNRKVIIPINYGNDYNGDKKKFIYEAQKYIDNGLYLDNYLPKEEYNNLYDSVSHIIMGHVRQQAIGNIIMAITRGVKIFLYKDSVAYKHYKTLGYIVFSIEEDLSEKTLIEPLSYEDALHNYNILKAINSQKLVDAEKAIHRMFE